MFEMILRGWLILINTDRHVIERFLGHLKSYDPKMPNFDTIWPLIWVTLSESFRTSIRGFSGSNHEDIFWNFPNWSTSNLRNWVSIYRQLQADCLYHINCLYNFPAYTWRQKRNAFPGLCNGSIFMIQKNLIIISGTEPRILCSEVIRKNNSSMHMRFASSNSVALLEIWLSDSYHVTS